MLEAYTLKALEASSQTNCVAEFLFDEASRRARLLDNVDPNERKALHGLPFSVKEHFFLKGRQATAGLYTRLGKPAEKEDASFGM